jgi:hypothetical protein
MNTRQYVSAVSEKAKRGEKGKESNASFSFSTVQFQGFFTRKVDSIFEWWREE